MVVHKSCKILKKIHCMCLTITMSEIWLHWTFFSGTRKKKELTLNFPIKWQKYLHKMVISFADLVLSIFFISYYHYMKYLQFWVRFIYEIGYWLLSYTLKYRIVASTNRCYYSENDFFFIFKVSNSNMPQFLLGKTFLFVVQMSWKKKILDKHIMCLSSSWNI